MYKKILFFLSCINLQLSHASSFSFELPGIKTLCAGISLGVAGTLAYKYYVKQCCSDLETYPTDVTDKLIKKSCKLLSEKLFHFYTKKSSGHFTMTYFGVHKGTTAIILEHIKRLHLNGLDKREQLKIVIPNADTQYRNNLMVLLEEAKDLKMVTKKSFYSLLSERNLNKYLLFTESDQQIFQGLPANNPFIAG